MLKSNKAFHKMLCTAGFYFLWTQFLFTLLHFWAGLLIYYNHWFNKTPRCSLLFFFFFARFTLRLMMHLSEMTILNTFVLSIHHFLQTSSHSLGHYRWKQLKRKQQLNREKKVGPKRRRFFLFHANEARVTLGQGNDLKVNWRNQ